MFDLEADLHVLTELRAAAQFIVQTLVNEAVELICAVATVVLTVAQQILVQALPVPTRVRRVVAALFWIIGRKKKILLVKKSEDSIR